MRQTLWLWILSKFSLFIEVVLLSIKIVPSYPITEGYHPEQRRPTGIYKVLFNLSALFTPAHDGVILGSWVDYGRCQKGRREKGQNFAIFI